MKFISVWLFLLATITVGLCQELDNILNRHPEIGYALHFNNWNRFHPDIVEAFAGVTWTPWDQAKRELAATPTDKRYLVCENIFNAYKEDFQNAKLAIQDEIEECGKGPGDLYIPKMKNKWKDIRTARQIDDDNAEYDDEDDDDDDEDDDDDDDDADDDEDEAIGRMKSPYAVGLRTTMRRRHPWRLMRSQRVIVPVWPNAKVSHYPWTVMLDFFYDSVVTFINANGGVEKKRIKRGGRCTGSIIHKKFVMTAAHCIPTRVGTEHSLIADTVALYPKRSSTDAKLMEAYKNIRQLYDMDKNSLHITGVSVENVKCIIYYGNFTMDALSGNVLWHEYAPKIVTNHEHMVYHPGFVNMNELRILGIPIPVLGHAQAQTFHYHTLNDIALIYLGDHQTFSYSRNVMSICVPAGKNIKTELAYSKCSLNYKDEFHIAGYGCMNYELGGGEICYMPTGLSVARFKLEDVMLRTEFFYSSDYIGKVLQGQDLNMKRHKKTKSKAQKHQSSMLLAPAAGDSGAPWVVYRDELSDRLGPERAYALAVQSTSNDISAAGPDILPLSDWIVQTMIRLVKPIQRP